MRKLMVAGFAALGAILGASLGPAGGQAMVLGIIGGAAVGYICGRWVNR